MTGALPERHVAARRIEFTLYRFWNGSELLYIGKSIHAYQRVKEHHSAAWFPSADRVTFERFPTALALSNAELTAIGAESPLMNVAGSTRPDRPAKRARRSPPGESRNIRLPAELVERIAGLANADRRSWSSWAALALERAAGDAEARNEEAT